MKSIMFLLMFISVFGIFSFPSSAHCGENMCMSEHNFTETKGLIDSEIPCENLTDGQLEEIGDYYMEQMHPGESHGIMDEMMGGESSENLKQMHIQIARNIYCGESKDIMGMMNMMAGYGMMDWSNMMYGYTGLGWLNQILLTIVLVLLILLLYKMYTKKR